jgi:hypothetical protein
MGPRGYSEPISQLNDWHPMASPFEATFHLALLRLVLELHRKGWLYTYTMRTFLLFRLEILRD